jgi:Zn-dependent peptidase ImmA (M78 family)/transcriptional regulator with XRE-family HTH domain
MNLNKGDSPQYALDRLDPQRISFARELRGLTKKQLADKIKKTQSAISQIERGMIRPDLETFVTISFALQVPISFFIKINAPHKFIDVSSCHFRSLRSTSQAMRRQSARRGDLCISLFENLESKGVIFPEEKISNFSSSVINDDEIENLAVDLRRHWKMGLGPIPSIIRLVESKGIFVLPLLNSIHQVDAYSTWKGNRPCIFLSYEKSASRICFDISHELGHLAMHEEVMAGELKTERQADRFAGAFLAPKESFIEECPRRWSFEAFRQLKSRWKMSIAALLYRAKDLGCISISTFKRAMVQLSIEGKRKDEGEEWPKEKPILISQALDLLYDRVTLDELASEMSIYPGELKDILTQYVPEEILAKLERKKDIDLDNIVKLRT